MARSHNFDPFMLAAAANTIDIEAVINNKVRLSEIVPIRSKKDSGDKELNQQKRDKNTLDIPTMLLLDSFVRATFSSISHHLSNPQ